MGDKGLGVGGFTPAQFAPVCSGVLQAWSNGVLAYWGQPVNGWRPTNGQPDPFLAHTRRTDNCRDFDGRADRAPQETARVSPYGLPLLS